MSSATRLADGTLGWLASNLDRFDPFSASAQRGRGRTMKAVLELALLCHCASRLDPVPGALGDATRLLRATWRNPDFPGLIAGSPPAVAGQYTLIAAALAPPGGVSPQLRAALGALARGGHLSPCGKSPYGRLETRFYADTAGLAHAIEPYPWLIERCILVSQPPAFPPTTAQAYEITHTSFYITDFGGSEPGCPPAMLTAARDLIRRVLAHAVREDLWDLAAELLLAWGCLGLDPAGTNEGQAAMASLARAQLPDGSIPGRSAATRAASAPGTLEFFRTAYHTTLVTALMSLVIGAGRRVLATSEGR
jgi:hypothetical protein